MSGDRPGSSAAGDDGMASSESEKDSEFDSASITAGGRHALRPNMLAIEDHESAGLVFQESFDDELPYIPTTLPEEKPVGIKLVPAKERTQIDLKTYPLERPRSTTPIHPGSLDKYCHDRTATGGGTRGALPARGSIGGDQATTSRDSTQNGANVAKLRISLPVRKTGEGSSKTGGATHRAFEHRSSLGAITMTTTTAGASASASGTGSTGRQYRSTSTTTAMMSSIVIKNRGIASEESPTPPPLPPRKASTSSASSAAMATPPGHKWIDVEAIPEMRKAPKRITAIPQKQQSQSQQQPSQTRNPNTDPAGPTLERGESAGPDGQLYNYVNPEDCQCECHEHERTAANSSASVGGAHEDMMVSSTELADDCRPLLRSSSSSLTAALSSTPVMSECTHTHEQEEQERTADPNTAGRGSTGGL
uniref:Uncharacterized protein n=1 Tax=Anopheles farauti TaxID=69004 RepID=A0A182Q0G1_9DIPT